MPESTPTFSGQEEMSETIMKKESYSHIAGLVVNYGISNTMVLEIP